jgi:hypothetical protein
VRRNEKKLLNDLMKGVRFPLKLRVQEPAHKSYVLLQVAVSSVEIKEFGLKVEQAEIVESALRILSALKELAIERGSGSVQESAILLNRALHRRMWEVDYGSIFLQVPGLRVETKNSLAMRGVRTIGDVQFCSATKVQDILACTQLESQYILAFAQMVRLLA